MDAVREGDGLRVIRCWRFLLPLFKSAKRKNYAKEALNLLSQIQLFLSPRQAQQLIWSRFVNTSGNKGHNISCDLHMEHLNRACKTAISSLGANTTQNAIICVGKCITPLVKALYQFDSQTGVPKVYGTHSTASLMKDIDLVVKELISAQVFKVEPNRQHPSFGKITSSIFLSLKRDKLIEWMKNTVTIP